MKQFQIKSWNRLIYTKSLIVAELPGTSDNLRRWVGIYPNVKKGIDLTVPDHKFSILDFELDVNQMEDYIGDEGMIMQNEKRIYVKDEHELCLLLEQLNIDPSLFDTPWKYDYPM